MDGLTSLSENSNISVILVLASVDGLFSFEIFLVLGMTKYFHLYLGCFGYCVETMNLV